MGKRIYSHSADGFSLIELVVVLAVVGICLAAAVVSLGQGVRAQAARGAAQCWQSGAAWAQIGVLWQGGGTRLLDDGRALTIIHEYGLSGGSLGSAGPGAPLKTNIARWRDQDKTQVRFGGDLASPDGAGSLWFLAGNAAYRVVVRLESGLTTRELVEAAP